MHLHKDALFSLSAARESILHVNCDISRGMDVSARKLHYTLLMEGKLRVFGESYSDSMVNAVATILNVTSRSNL